ncbi:MAG: site-2 protease family protein [Vicinamibacteria bacterium]
MPDFDAQALALGLTNYLILLFSLSFHESAHAWMALKLGDDTAASLGRITLNPVPHIDLFGTVLMPLIQIFTGLGVLGWAKPTPYDAGRFRRDVSLRRGHISVAIVGPLSNLILVTLFTVLLFITIRVDIDPAMQEALKSVFSVGILLNISLFLFNLLPVPPLDGSHVVSWSLPRSIGERFDQVAENYGNLILWVLFLSGLLRFIIGPPTAVMISVINALLQ